MWDFWSLDIRMVTLGLDWLLYMFSAYFPRMYDFDSTGWKVSWPNVYASLQSRLQSYYTRLTTCPKDGQEMLLWALDLDIYKFTYSARSITDKWNN